MKFTAQDTGKTIKVVRNKHLYSFSTGILYKCPYIVKRTKKFTFGGSEWAGVTITEGHHDCGGACNVGEKVWAYVKDIELID